METAEQIITNHGIHNAAPLVAAARDTGLPLGIAVALRIQRS